VGIIILITTILFFIPNSFSNILTMLQIPISNQSVDDDDPSLLIDTELYPIVDLNSEAARELIRKCRTELQNTGVCMLPDFLRPAVIQRLVEETREVAPSAYHSDNYHNVYLEEDSEDLPPSHARRMLQKSAKTCITNDQIPSTSALNAIYKWDNLTQFLAKVLDKDVLYQTADPLGAINIHIYNKGEQLGWHFDRGEFAISLLLQSPDEGGHFEYVPQLRTKGDNNYEEVRKVLLANDEQNPQPEAIDDDESRKRLKVIRLDLRPGMLVFFCGHCNMHRVTTVTGDKPRIISILSYETRPGVMLNEYTRMKFYGRLN
jgi:alkylated DNA repair dioxygenase AlkB